MSYYKKKYGFSQKEFPCACKVSFQSVALPIGPHVSLSDISHIIKNIKDILEKKWLNIR